MNFSKSSWRLVQIGVKLSTTSMICLVQELLSSSDVKFVLIALFAQDALENLFSQIKNQGVPYPQPVQFCQALRFVCLSHFVMIPNSSNYEEDDTPMLLDFIKPYDVDNVISEGDYALGILSSVVEDRGGLAWRQFGSFPVGRLTVARFSDSLGCLKTNFKKLTNDQEYEPVSYIMISQLFFSKNIVV